MQYSQRKTCIFAYNLNNENNSRNEILISVFCLICFNKNISSVLPLKYYLIASFNPIIHLIHKIFLYQVTIKKILYISTKKNLQYNKNKVYRIFNFVDLFGCIVCYCKNKISVNTLNFKYILSNKILIIMYVK